MKQKKRKVKGRNAVNMKNKLVKSTTAYKPIKSDTKDYRKNNYNTQIDNKEINGNKTMSMGLEGEDKNKSKTKTMDSKEEKPSLPKETVTTTTTTTFSQLELPESEVFDSSSDNAMSEMKQVADMGPDETSKVFLHVEEKQKLDSLTVSNNDDTVTKTVPENNLNTNPTRAEPTLDEIDSSNRIESKEDDVLLMQNVKPDISQDHKKSEQRDRLGKSVSFDDELNKEYSSDSLNNNDENNNPFISGIKLWRAYNEIWTNAYSGYMKTWLRTSNSWRNMEIIFS